MPMQAKREKKNQFLLQPFILVCKISHLGHRKQLSLWQDSFYYIQKSSRHIFQGENM
jgi:hypothetical protein